MSNRLTFSLASLIVLLTFGLVFGTTSVMAHDAPTQHPARDGSVSGENPGTHRHDGLNPVKAIQADSSATPPVVAVPAHNSHPMVESIVLKGDPATATVATVRGNMAVVTSAAASFTLVITFDQDVVSGPGFPTVASDVVDPTATTLVANNPIGGSAAAEVGSDVTLGDFSVTFLNADITTASTDARIAIPDTTITRVAGRDDQFEAVVTLSDNDDTNDDNPFPSGNMGADARIFKILLDANAVYSLQTSPSTSLTSITGSGSTESDVYEFMLVNALGELPTAPGAPMNLMADVNHQRGSITLNWNAPSDTGGTTATPATITGYTVTKNYMMDGTAADPVTKETADTTFTFPPESTDPDLLTDTEFTFTVTATNSAELTGPASDPAKAMIDTISPTVTIGDPEVDEADGTVSFTITVSEMLADGADALELNDLTITGDDSTMRNLSDPVKRTDTDGNEVYDYTLTVTPDENMSVTVTLTGDIRDLANNMADVTTTPITATYDVTPPSLESYTITAILDDDEVTDQLLVTLVFNEDVETDRRNGGIDIDGHRGSDVTQRGNAVAVDGEDHTYEVTVDAPDHATSEHTYMTLEAGLADLAVNLTQDDIPLTYTPPEVDAPTVEITADPDPLNCDMGSTITFAITGTTETLVIGDITVSAGWIVSTTDNDPSDGDIDIVPDGNNAIGVTTVTVTVAEDAVGTHDAEPETFTVGPVLEIPAGGYILVSHPSHIDPNYPGFSQSHILDPLVLGRLPIRAPEVVIQEWDCMPDLTVFFGLLAPALGGGALVVKESPENDSTNNPVAVGSVGITEIMWGSDEGITHGGFYNRDGRLSETNYAQTREQWIELHNRNPHKVYVTLFARSTNQALTIETDEIDRVSNYNIVVGSRNVWPVPGQSGNSEFGNDFVSMQRVQDVAKAYNHADINGSNSGKWSASTLSYLTDRARLWQTLDAEQQNYDFRGTPGRSNTLTPDTLPEKTVIPYSPVIFNEIANRRDQTLEWIELKNVSENDVDLRNYEISIVTGVDKDARLFHFNYGDNQVIIPAGGLLLLVDTDPRYNDAHPVAIGYNVRGGEDQVLGIGNPPRDDVPRYLITDFAEGGLPDTEGFVLILRESKDDEGYEDNKGKPNRIVDVVGYDTDLEKAADYTLLWPLKVFGAPNSHNEIKVETVYRRQHATRDPSNVPDNKVGNAALGKVVYSGVGYKRHAQRIDAHGGSPGYEHGTPQVLVSNIASTGVLTISEIMFDQGDGEYPQWIEIYNSSPTQPVDLHSEAGWRLVIENFDDGEIPIETLSGTLNFNKSDVKTILPQQTVVVTSTRARNSGSAFFDTSVVFPPTRVFSAWDDQRGELTLKPADGGRPTDPILSEKGFYIELIDGKGNFSDGVGNLVKSPNRRVAATIAWELSEVTGEMMEDDAPRSSILRKYRDKEKKRYSDAEIEMMGIEAAGWVAAHETDFRDVRQTWYGHQDDIGSPGITGGRVLPVSLSKFRPERLESGDIVIRWITESELNNAGFNILRSDTRSGEFAQVNTKLIAGQGTTSEKTNYEWKDTSAKPNVVYYYQIQDVSLDGQVATLALTRLKGHISAAGKLTTTWGELKALQ